MAAEPQALSISGQAQRRALTSGAARVGPEVWLMLVKPSAKITALNFISLNINKHSNYLLPTELSTNL